jgi:hypothetical protein
MGQSCLNRTGQLLIVIIRVSHCESWLLNSSGERYRA